MMQYNKFEVFSCVNTLSKNKEVSSIFYNNNMKNQPEVFVINNADDLCEIIRRNCRHHKFIGLNSNDVLCEKFNENYALDLLDEFCYGDPDEKYIILHFINTTYNVKEYIEYCNDMMRLRIVNEIKYTRKQLCNLKKAYA